MSLKLFVLLVGMFYPTRLVTCGVVECDWLGTHCVDDVVLAPWGGEKVLLEPFLINSVWHSKNCSYILITIFAFLFRQGEKWFHLRRHLTAELTSPNTMQGFLPELNRICDDFLDLLQSCRKPDGTVQGFDQLTNRVGLECRYLYNT